VLPFAVIPFSFPQISVLLCNKHIFLGISFPVFKFDQKKKSSSAKAYLFECYQGDDHAEDTVIMPVMQLFVPMNH